MTLIGIPGQVNVLGQKGSPQQGAMGMSNSVNQTPEEQERIKLLTGMFQQASQFRSRWDRHWPRFWNLWEGNHYYSKVVHTLTRAVINQVFSAVETFVGHVGDTLTLPNVFARDPNFRGQAKTVTKWLRTVWEQSGAEEQLQHVLRSAAVTGVGWIEIPWDRTLCNGRGNPAFLPVDERYMFVSPHCRNTHEARYLIEAKNVPREYVEEAWPERGGLVPPGIWYPQVSNERMYTGASPEGDQYSEFLTTDQSQSGWSRMAGVDPKTSRDLVTLMKFWIRQKDGSMGFMPVSNGILLIDPENPDATKSPYQDEDFPYAQLNLLPTLDSPYGRSIVQFIESLQEVVDLSLSYLLDVQRYAADPMLVVHQLNFEQMHLVENMPGAILPDMSEGGSGYQWLQGPGFNQQWMQIIEQITSAMDSVLGRVDVLKGERPAGVNTLGGLEIIRDEANVRIRNLNRWVKSAVKRSYHLILSRLRQFATDERTLRVPDKKGKEDYITVNPMQGNAPDGTPQQEQTLTDDAEYEMDFGPEEPGGEQARKEFVFQALSTPAEDGLPLVTRKWALEKLDIQEMDEILAEIDNEKNMQAQAMQAQQPQDPNAPQQDQAAQDPMAAIASLFGGQ